MLYMKYIYIYKYISKLTSSYTEPSLVYIHNFAWMQMLSKYGTRIYNMDVQGWQLVSLVAVWQGGTFAIYTAYSYVGHSSKYTLQSVYNSTSAHRCSTRQRWPVSTTHKEYVYYYILSVPCHVPKRIYWTVWEIRCQSNRLTWVLWSVGIGFVTR